MAKSRPSVSETSHLSELPRVISLFSATMLGVGAMIGAGIFVLSGIAAGEAGPAKKSSTPRVIFPAPFSSALPLL